MKKSRDLYYIFVAFLIVFFWRTTDFWYYSRYAENVENAGLLLYAALAGVELVSLYMIVFSPNYRNQNNRIGFLCFIWEIAMLVVLIFNRTAFSQYFKCLAWPLFFQASYLFIRYDKHLLSSFRKFFTVLAVMGGFYLVSAFMLGDLESQTNMVYFFVLTIPAVILSYNKKWRYYILIFSTFD